MCRSLYVLGRSSDGKYMYVRRFGSFLLFYFMKHCRTAHNNIIYNFNGECYEVQSRSFISGFDAPPVHRLPVLSTRNFSAVSPS